MNFFQQGSTNGRQQAMTKGILRVVVAIYLVYLAVKIYKGVGQGGSSMPAWLGYIFALFFVLAALGVCVYSYISYKQACAGAADAAEQTEKVGGEQLSQAPQRAELSDTYDVFRSDEQHAGLTPLCEVYRSYLEDVKRVEAESKPTDGLLGLGSDPSKHACHQAFYDKVGEQLLSLLAAQPDNEEAMAALLLILKAPAQQRDNQLAFPMLYAAHGYAVKLIGFLDRADSRELAEWYNEAYSRIERMPVQEETLAMLKAQAEL